MSEAETCSWDGCFENIEHICEVCKQSFCSKHGQKGQFTTDQGKLQFATLCLNHRDYGLSDQRNTNDNSRILKQVGIVVAIIVIIFYLLTR